MIIARTVDINKIYSAFNNIEVAIYQNDKRALNKSTATLSDAIAELQKFLKSHISLTTQARKQLYNFKARNYTYFGTHDQL